MINSSYWQIVLKLVCFKDWDGSHKGLKTTSTAVLCKKLYDFALSMDHARPVRFGLKLNTSCATSWGSECDNRPTYVEI